MNRQDKQAVERYRKKIERARQSVYVNPFETSQEQKAAIERARKNYAFMVKRYFPHLAGSEVPDFHITHVNRVKKNKTYKGFDVEGRGLAKSMKDTVLLPFWLWINKEPMYEVIIGASQEKAELLLEDLRAEFEANPQIIADFGEQYNQGSWEKGFYVTKGGFIGQALGRGQSVRGLRVKKQRPTYIITDDIETSELIKNPKRLRETANWIETSLIPTMDGDYRRYIHANNRWAVIMVMTILKEKHPDWDWYQVNAYDPVTYAPAWKEKYTPDYYRQFEKDIGTLAAMSEFNNQPHVEGEIFKESMIQWAKLPALNHFKIIIGHWDAAYSGSASSDYNAVVVMGLYNQDFWIIDGFCKQCRMREAVAYMCEFQRSLPPTVIAHWQFESQFWNDEVERTIREAEREYRIHLNITKKQNPRTNKYDRILSLHPYYQNGRIYYNERLKSHADTQVGISQLLGIEPGYKSHDDYPDAQEAVAKELEKYISYDSGGFQILQGNYKPNFERL